MFVFAEDVPPPTTGLDYQIARILSEQSASNANSNSSSSEATFQFWEVGGGKQMSKMVEIGLTADNVQRAMAVIVLDLSKVFHFNPKICTYSFVPIILFFSCSLLVSSLICNIGSLHSKRSCQPHSSRTHAPRLNYWTERASGSSKPIMASTKTCMSFLIVWFFV
jgi:hypothetical protein